MPKKKPKKTERQPWFDDVSTQTKQAIVAVALFALAVFFVLAALASAGIVGTYAHSFLTLLFGVAAYLMPLVCLLFMYPLLRPREDERVSTAKLLGITLLFLSILAGIELVTPGNGGWIGFGVLWPFQQLIGSVAAGVILTATSLISLFLTFNTGLRFPRRAPVDEEVLTEEELAHIEPPAVESEGDEGSDEEPEEAVTEEKSSGFKNPFSRGKKSEAEFVVSSFVGSYTPPPLSLLKKDRGRRQAGDIKANSNIIKRTLHDFGINVEMDAVESGPTVTRYSLKPAQGVKLSKIVNLQRELELNLGGSTIRIEAPIPGKSLVGIEVPNASRSLVGLGSLLSTPEYTDSDKPLLAALGKDITGHAHFANIARMPHCLIAGTTGSGKSVMIHNLMLSLLYRNSPEQLRFIMVDPKRVELSLYNGIPHLLTPVINDAKKALLSLKWAVKEMERRLELLEEHKVQNVALYHEKVYRPAKAAWVEAGEPEDEKSDVPEALPYIVIVMDELADLMHAYPRELEALIVRIAQMARAAGIHLMLATQRPSVNVITGTIKANIPTRIAFNVASQIDSRTILDQIGAEKLIGQGDMLYITGELSKPIRIQSSFVTDDELNAVIDYLKNLDDVHELDSIDFESKEVGGDAFFSSSLDGDDADDELYEEARIAVMEAGKASTSFLQRKLRIGYSRAARLIDILEERGIVGPQDGSRPREIIAQSDTDFEDESVFENSEDTSPDQSKLS